MRSALNVITVQNLTNDLKFSIISFFANPGTINRLTRNPYRRFKFKHIIIDTDGNKILHSLLVKHYNELLDRQSSERSRDEVTYFYVGDVFCKHLGTTYTDLQEKIFAEISGKKDPNVLKRALERNFFGYNIRLLPEHSLGSNPYPRIY